MKFRIVRRGRDGKYQVERKCLFGWSPAIVHPSVWASIPATYDTFEDARADMIRLFKTPNEVVWESL